MLAKATLLGGHLSLLLGGGDVIIVIDARSRLTVGMSSLALTTSSGTKGIELGGQLSLRFDERATVIAHWLIASVGVLGEQGESRRDEEHDEKHKRESGVDDEEDDAHDSSHDSL